MTKTRKFFLILFVFSSFRAFVIDLFWIQLVRVRYYKFRQIGQPPYKNQVRITRSGKDHTPRVRGSRADYRW